jgi:hypothetical protein
MDDFAKRDFPMQDSDVGMAADDASRMISSVIVKQGGAPGDFIPWSRNAYKVDSQSHQLADVGNARHLCDQLVFYRQGRNRGFDCRPRDRH